MGSPGERIRPLMLRHALLITGGPAPRNVGVLPKADLVIAADEGFDNARSLGIHVDLLVGDLDSASPGAADQAPAVERHPVDKDETDLELALAAALNAGMTSVTVVGTIGGRVDHALGNLLVVAADRWAGIRIDLRTDGPRAWVVPSGSERPVHTLDIGMPEPGTTRWRGTAPDWADGADWVIDARASELVLVEQLECRRGAQR